ncbi:FAD-dependent monooxygenase [Brevibacterium casei]|uniref:FAD-dependent monooxygenase n=2 Tax=Brevibacteriaceae TaxID=85019 RepID=UPI001643987E|nr:FAD-dependent monooxygenase [Brevibacterium casei]
MPSLDAEFASLGSRYRDGMTSVRIIGSGIAGATLAAALDRPEWTVTVHERDPQARALDTAFALFPSAMTALRRAGLSTAVEKSGVRVDEATIRSSDGRLLARPPRLGALMIGRAQLHSLLTAARPASTPLLTGEVADPTTLAADVLVGADGARSAVRSGAWGGRTAPRRPPLTVIRGVIDADLSAGAVTEYWGDRMLFGITPLPGNRTNWFTAFPERRFATTAAGLDHLRRAARVFPSPVTAVVEAARTGQTVISGIHVSRPLRSFVRGRTVLIGDSAHAMQPNLGRGACESICDAVTLAELLNADEPASALARYSRRRVVTPQVIHSGASVASGVALAGGPVGRVRDRVLSALARLGTAP